MPIMRMLISTGIEGDCWIECCQKDNANIVSK